MASETSSDFQDSGNGSWWKRGLFLFSAIAAIVIAVVLLASNPASEDTSDLLTHRISRGELLVTVTELGTLESSDNTEIKCRVRGENTVIWVVENGTHVQPGDELVRLDTLYMEEQIAERTKYALWTRSGAEQSRANFERSKLAVGEYENGRYIVELKTLQKDRAIAESNLLTARNLLDHSKKMAESGYVSELDVEEKSFAVTRAKLDVDLLKTEIDVLENFTRNEELASLKGDLRTADSRLKAEQERVYADDHRLARAEEELEYCIVRAERAGMVIYPSSARWKDAPEIEEGATVHKDQVLLLMPDLTQMQVKVGIHESIVDRIHPGLPAKVTVSGRIIEADVASVASVTSPAGWWTGNQVKYDTIIKLPSNELLKPGMSADVEVILARHSDVLTIPVAAVLETEELQLCWVQTPDGPQRRELQLGDSNDVSIVIKDGLSEGEEVILNPLASIEEAQDEAAKTLGKIDKEPADSVEPAGKSAVDPVATKSSDSKSSA